MKKKEFKKTLNLNKQRISSLNNNDMMKIKGGSLYESVSPREALPSEFCGMKGAEKEGTHGSAKEKG